MVVGHSAQEWTEGELWNIHALENGDYGPSYDYIDNQWANSESVCIDVNAVSNEYQVLNWEWAPLETALATGSLECLDEPGWAVMIIFVYDIFSSS